MLIEMTEEQVDNTVKTLKRSAESFEDNVKQAEKAHEQGCKGHPGDVIYDYLLVSRLLHERASQIYEIVDSIEDQRA